MQELTFFPISIGIENVPEFGIHKKKILEFIKKKNFVFNNKSRDLTHSHTTKNQLILDDPDLSYLKNFLETKSNDYYQDILGFKESLYLSDSWINICSKGGYQVDHYHSNCVVSGTLYVQIGNGYSPITFKNPRTNNQPLTNEIKSLRSKDTTYNMDWVSVQNLQEGSVVFWPSYLVHGYEKNNFENRISISFNLNIRRSDFLYASPFSEI